MESYDERKEGIKNSIKNMVEGALMDIIEQSSSYTISVDNMDKLAKSTRLTTPWRNKLWEVRPLLGQKQYLLRRRLKEL